MSSLVFSCSNKEKTCISFRLQRYDDILKAGAQSALRVCDDYVTGQYCMLQKGYDKGWG